MNPVPDASAAGAAGMGSGGGGGINASYVITADTDSTRWVGGNSTDSDYLQNGVLAEGPLMLTDVLVDRGAISLFHAPIGSCSQSGPVTTLAELGSSSTETAETRGARMFVPAGRQLCASSVLTVNEFYWSGYRPYR